MDYGILRAHVKTFLLEKGLMDGLHDLHVILAVVPREIEGEEEEKNGRARTEIPSNPGR